MLSNCARVMPVLTAVTGRIVLLHAQGAASVTPAAAAVTADSETAVIALLFLRLLRLLPLLLLCLIPCVSVPDFHSPVTLD